MRRRFLFAIAFALVAMPVIAFAAGRSEPQTMREAGGLVVYLGVLPAEMIRGHPARHEEAAMHKGPRRGIHLYHVMVAVFDAQTGKRVEDAVVAATVISLGLAGTRQTLEPMHIADTTTYGNYFDLGGSSHYRIAVDVQPPGNAKPITVEFAYQHPVR